MQNDRIAWPSMLKKERESMVGNDGRPNNSGGLDNDVAVEVLFILKV